MIIIEFILSIIFVCLLISLFVSWIIVYWASHKNKKGELLKKMLGKLLDEEKENKWVNKLYEHPIVKSLSFDDKRKTSNIPPQIFADAIVDIVIQEGSKNNETKGLVDFREKLEKGLTNLPDGDFKNSIQIFVNKTEGEIKSLLSELENWYTEYMQRVNHAYRRTLKLPLFFTGAIIALLFNIDTIRITSELWNDAPLRGNVSEMAVLYSDTTKTTNIDSLQWNFFDNAKTELELPIGWEYYINDFCYYKTKTLESIKTVGMTVMKPFWSGLLVWVIFLLFKILGFTLTGLIASFGAPFWYDALKKIIGLKKSLKN